jgi:hypothetical protein
MAAEKVHRRQCDRLTLELRTINLAGKTRSFQPEAVKCGNLATETVTIMSVARVRASA